jgi:hypothetical protein
MPIRWHQGRPPRALAKSGRLLVIAHPSNRADYGLEGALPDLYVGHFSKTEDAYVPASIAGMSQDEARPALNILYWADINLPDGVEVRRLTDGDAKG